MLYSQLATLLASLLLLTSPIVTAGLQPRRPQPRNYDTHAYYALELDPSISPKEVLSITDALSVELVEPIGELAGHWLVRAPSTPQLRSTSQRRHLEVYHDHIHSRHLELRSRHPQLRSFQPLSLRQRAKRIPPTSPYLHRRSPRPLHWSSPRQAADAGEDKTELLFAQNELDLQDPMLGQQWHLINTQMRDWELNVTGLWQKGITGEGVAVCIVDDGLDMKSDDLKDNFVRDHLNRGWTKCSQYEGSYDFNDHTELPEPRLSDDQHGTRCAGEIAAAPNDVCGVGVSYSAKISGVRILSAPISDADEAAALNYGYQINDIYSCSWGPPDDGKSMEAPEGLILKAMVNGVQRGRGGKGNIFVFAAGNGGGADDQCNFDGYTNSIFSITVGAIDRRGLHPYYSEMCSAMMIVAPSSGSGDHIVSCITVETGLKPDQAQSQLTGQHTTDVGKNNCAHNHGGTSAAAPLAAGVFALALQARPDLTWRDFQHIAVRSAVFFNSEDPDWQKTASGKNYSYKYGYGKLDAHKFVDLAEKFTSVKPQAWFDSPAIHLPRVDPPPGTAPSATKAVLPGNDNSWRRQEAAPVVTMPPLPSGLFDPISPGSADPDTDPNDAPASPPPPPQPTPEGSFITETGVHSSFVVTKEMLEHANLEKLEHVTVRVWITHEKRGNVEVELISPNGIPSVLARQRRFDEDGGGFWGWKFMSLKHWDEDPVGEWKIIVTDRSEPEKIGRFVAWSLQLWGASIDPNKVKVWAPAEDGQPDEEETGSEPATSTAVSQKPKPTDHLPGDHGEAEGESHEPGLGQPTPLPGSGSTGDGGDASEAGGSGTGEEYEEGWFSGVASLASNPTWLAGAGGILLVGAAAGGGYFALRQRKKRRNLFGLSNNGEGARGAYAPVGDDVPMGLLERSRRKLGGNRAGGEAGGGGTKDLYDAFGDGPSEDDESEGDERVGLRYHDSFLEDEDASPVDASSGAGKVIAGRDQPPAYEDDDDSPPRESTPVKDGRGTSARTGALSGGSNSGSSSSWQDAEEDVRR